MNNISRFESLSVRVKTALLLAGGLLVALLAAAFSCIGASILAFGFCLAVGLAAWEAIKLQTENFSVHTMVGVLLLVLLLGPAVIPLIMLGSTEQCNQGGALALDAFTLVAVISLIISFLSQALVIMRSRSQIEHAQRLFQEIPGLVLLIGAGGGALVSLCFVAQGAALVFWLVLVVSLNDIGAYFGGSYLKGPKIAPAISPNKTVSGCLCGFAAGMMAGVICALILFPLSSPVPVLASAAVVVLCAQLGDLFKSYAKRLHGAKDSGTILPGHGGVLDRIDGILGAAPAMLLVTAAAVFF